MDKLNCLAITGGMGTGKSTVLKFFESHDFIIYDSDKIVGNLLYDYKSPYYLELAQVFDNWLGTDFRHQLGIDKKILRPYLENTENGFPISLEIVKPFVQSVILDLYEQSLINNKKVIFEVPVLFEANWQDKFDKILLVTCDMETRIQRIQVRSPHLSVEQIKQTINSQKPESEKIPYSHYIINNSSTLNNLNQQLINILPDIEQYYKNNIKQKNTFKY